MKQENTWGVVYGGAEFDSACVVRQTHDGGFILAGFAHSAEFGGFGGEDIYLVKTNGRGKMSWAKAFGGTKHDGAHGLAIVADGGFRSQSARKGPVMTNQEARESIKEYGDLLERHMYSDDEFAALFSIYPMIWNKHLLPKRTPGTLSLTSDEWQRFAESHYTAVVRCWNAMKNVKRVSETAMENISEFDAAKAQLDFHDAFACFFYFAGAAVDNLRHAFEVRPVQCQSAFESIFGHDVADGRNLNWFFRRRHQFIHKALVPCVEESKLLSVDVSFFDEIETKWDKPCFTVKLTDAVNLVESLWSQFSAQMHAAWSKLFEMLNEMPAGPSSNRDVAPEVLPRSSGNIDFPKAPPSGATD